MPSNAKVLKRCARCGKASRVAPRDSRCKRPAGTEGSWHAATYVCWGRLTRVERPAVPAAASDKLAAKLAHAHAQFALAITRMRRALTTVDRWQRRIKAAERLIAQRDHPELKPVRVAPKAKPTRAIALEE